MYNVTREHAAEQLNMSTRSIDRYIRAGKLRSQKIWKIVYIHEDDVHNFLEWWNKKQEVIIPQSNSENISSTAIEVQQESDIKYIFGELKSEIAKKDEEIKHLSIQLWKMEEIVKNSITLVEFKQSQFLLEESKNSIITDLDNTKKELHEKTQLLTQEKKLNLILVIMTVLVIILFVVVWFVRI